jgi:hypothetical protein
MKTVAIDFDGVIHAYTKGWGDGTCYDIPVDGAFAFIKDLLNKDYSVFILSTRNAEHIDRWFYNQTSEFDTEIISDDTQFWNTKGIVGITNRKLPAHIYIDDRGLRFNGRFDNLINEVEQFKTWQGS